MSSNQSRCSKWFSDMPPRNSDFNDDSDFDENTREKRVERSINRVTLLGRMGKDPEFRGTKEHPVVVFPLATNKSYRKSTGELMHEVTWHRIVVFRPGVRNNICPRLGKGDRVMIDGQISYHTVNKDGDHINNNITSILADDIILLTKKHRVQYDDDDDF